MPTKKTTEKKKVPKKTPTKKVTRTPPKGRKPMLEGTTMNAETGTKRLGLLHELLPQAVRFAVLVNPINSLTEPFVADLRAAAAVFGAQMDVFNCSTIGEIADCWHEK